MSKLPLIGLLGHKHKGHGADGYGQNEAYVEYFRKFGDVIILDAQCEAVLPLDLLVLPGGRDVNPMNYGQKPGMTTQAPDLEYEWFMSNMLHKYLERTENNETAIYGICAGFQHIVSYFGGELVQEMAQDQSTTYRGELVDRLAFNKSIDWLSKLENNYSKNKNFMMTNSIHHQGAEPNGIVDEFDILATNTKFDNVEFIMHQKFPIAAEQSHPEERVHPILSNYIINTLIKRVKQ